MIVFLNFNYRIRGSSPIKTVAIDSQQTGNGQYYNIVFVGLRLLKLKRLGQHNDIERHELKLCHVMR